MDWKRLSFDWNHARTFLAAAEQGSLSSAGRALGLAQPTVGRQVSALEEELGVVLFERVGRGLQITPTGVELVEQIRVMADAAARVSRVAAGHSLTLEGTVAISAGEVLAVHTLPPIVARVRELHPGITIEIVATNQTSDLGMREADIAIRSYRPKDVELVARKLRDDVAYLYATPEYLNSLGELRSPADLSRAEFVAFDHGDAFMTGLNALGVGVSTENFTWVCGNQQVQWALVAQGSGIGVMMADVGDADPRVVRVLPELFFPVPLWLTTHREVRTSRRVRVVYDVLAEALSE